jgi:hypothetical protein
MQAIAELAPTEAADLEAERAKLRTLFDDHTNAEDQRVFPRALGCYRQKSAT